MKHIERLIMKELRKPLETLEKEGVGYIDGENTNTFHYVIDGAYITIRVDATRKENEHDGE